MQATPTLRQLRFLVAVVDRRHFGKAAEACLVSQSTLSAAIQELELLLGVQLLERSKRHVLVTPIGQELAERARDLLQGMDDFVNVAEAAQDPNGGRLVLGVIPTIAPFVLPQLMPQLQAAFPRLRLYLREDQSARLIQQLKDGVLDATLLALPYPTDDFHIMVLADDPFWLACPKGHCLVAGGPVTLHSLANENMLLLEEGHCLREHALAACGLAGAKRNRGFQGTSLHTLIQMVDHGLGITLLPQIAIHAGCLRNSNVQALPLAQGSANRQLALVWRKSSAKQAMLTHLGHMIQHALTPGAQADQFVRRTSG